MEVDALLPNSSLCLRNKHKTMLEDEEKADGLGTSGPKAKYSTEFPEFCLSPISRMGAGETPAQECWKEQNKSQEKPVFSSQRTKKGATQKENIQIVTKYHGKKQQQQQKKQGPSHTYQQRPSGGLDFLPYLALMGLLDPCWSGIPEAQRGAQTLACRVNVL